MINNFSKQKYQWKLHLKKQLYCAGKQGNLEHDFTLELEY